eukprot:SAG22_NODE_297_length_12786_cov_3.360290_4_plen_2527_part_00
MTRKNRAIQYDVRQTHLGFCPSELVLEVCAWGLVLEYDGKIVEKHPFTELIMWSASRDRITLMTVKNLKRIVLKTTGASKAKRVVIDMMKAAERLRRKLEPRVESELVSAGENGADDDADGSSSPVVKKTEQELKDERNKARLQKHMSVVQFGSSDSEDFKMPAFLTFQGIQQTHIPGAPATVLLRVDEDGVGLLDRVTRQVIEQHIWTDILLWKADAEPPALVLLLSQTGRQIRLETSLAPDIMTGMTDYTRKLLNDRSEINEQVDDDIRDSDDHHDDDDGAAWQAPLAKQSARELVIEFRTKLLAYEPRTNEVHEHWITKVTTVGKLRHRLQGQRLVDLSTSIETRDQLRTIFNSVDKDHSGTLESKEVGQLLEDLSMQLSADELKDTMQEIGTNSDGEIEFEEFVTWVSSQGSAETAANLKQQINHRRKEIKHLQELFDRIDEDCNGTMDVAEFQQLTVDIGMALNTIELQSIWLELDADGSGEVEFEEFVQWFKGQNKGIAGEMRRTIRMTKMLACAKGAMVYAVDQGNRAGKKKLREMFDHLDKDGSGELGKGDMLMLAADLKVQASDEEIGDAMDQMDGDSSGQIDFDEFRKWWCSTGGGNSGMLRAKLKLAGFTSKSSGAVITITQTSDEGAMEAERQLDELLTSAFAKPVEMTGKSLGIFGPSNPLRLHCHKIIYNPVTDRVLLTVIFLNLLVMALQTPGTEKSAVIAFVIFFIVVIFSFEMGMRIISHGLLRGEKAYLRNGWNLFDGIIISTVWVLYILTIVFTIDESISYLVTLLRSFRALRFFSNMRQILLAIIQGRAMLSAVATFVLLMFVLYYVILHQLYSGAFTLTCSNTTECGTECSARVPQCPAAFQCDETETSPMACFFRNNTVVANSYDRLQHTDKFGFDSLSQSFLTTFNIATLDEWSFLSSALRKSSLSTAALAWPTLASLVVAISLFTVNIFVSSLAFSYIKVRKTARNLDSKNQIEKNAVDAALNDGLKERIKYARHFLQGMHPTWTRKARWLLRQAMFEYTVIFCVLANIICMMLVQHNMSAQLVYFLEGAEIIFTIIYAAEMAIKIQAMGPQQYCSVRLNILDGAIVLSAMASYVLLLLSIEVDARRAAILRVFRLLRLVRVARVAKIVFRSPELRDMMTKAFSGMDAIVSLIIFMLFFLSVCAIGAMNLFYHCHNGTFTGHRASFRTFRESFLTTFQVFTTDSWGSIMAETMTCAGSASAIYFFLVIFIGNIVLGNMFIAIFIENLEISDEDKRNKQIEVYIQEVNIAGDQEGGVSAMTAALGSINKTLDKSDANSALKHYTFDALVKGAKLTPKLAGQIFGGTNADGESSGGLMSRLRGSPGQTSAISDDVDMSIYGGMADASLGFFYPHNPVRILCQRVAASRLFHYMMTCLVMLCTVSTALTVEVQRGAIVGNGTYAVHALQAFLFLIFGAELACKVVADGFLSTRKAYWKVATNRFELALVLLQFWSLLYPQFEVFLCVRVCRLLYMVRRIRVMVEAFTSSMVAVWTVLVLMAVTFVVYGIAGVFLFSGLLWHCEGDVALGHTACDAAGFQWINRPFHFDNIVESSSSLFIIWSMQGWTSVWFWAIDSAEEVDMAPSLDQASLSASVYCISFILWNSFLLTKLFTGMLADFFAQSSGSILMTSQQRNWQFMSMFIYSALKDDTRQPPKSVIRRCAFMIVNASWFHYFLNFVIVVNVSSMVGESATVQLDPTGLLVLVTNKINAFTLAIYTVEAMLRIVALGGRQFWHERKLDCIVLVAMAAAAGYHHYAHELVVLEQYGIRVDWILALQFVRALRLTRVFGEVYSIRKIYFILGMSVAEVANLLAFMAVVFFIFGVWFQSICGGIPRGVAITDTSNFDTVRSSVMYLFEICTGTSLVGVVDECRLYNGPQVPLYFYLFFLMSNLVLLNLFVALLLDNFDLMGSDDFAVSDIDIQLFKDHWKGYGLGLHQPINVADLRHFLLHKTKGMGTFGMMPEADPYYFNRVLFELELTHDDVLAAVKEVAFFPLLLALCHMRFSSSCLSLGEEVEKSNRLMARVEVHAARLIQIAWAYHRAHKTVPPEYEDPEARIQWNSAVRTSWILQAAATISTDRITPEHVVADNLDRLQILVDRKESQKIQKDHSKSLLYDERPAQVGDEVRILKHGSYYGKVAILIDPELPNRKALVDLDGSEKSYKLSDLERVERDTRRMKSRDVNQRSVDRMDVSTMLTSFDSDDSLSDAQVSKHRKKSRKKVQQLKDMKQSTKNPMMSKSVIGMSGDALDNLLVLPDAAPAVGVRNLNPMLLGSFDSEDFFDNDLTAGEDLTTVSVKKSRKGRTKTSRLANLKDTKETEDDAGGSLRQVNPIQSVLQSGDVQPNTAGEVKDKGKKSGKSKKTRKSSKKEKKEKKERGKRQGLTSFETEDERAESPGPNLRIDNPINMIKSDDMQRSADLLVPKTQNPLMVMMSDDNPHHNEDTGKVRMENPPMISQPSFDQKSLSVAMQRGTSRSETTADSAASKDDVMKTLAWKERNAFMTRKAK